uniref:Uncharacterized protein n=1 Tax=Rhizophora mucronata TaxID=61149 RepID=A0A2P2LR99_RHIMU
MANRNEVRNAIIIKHELQDLDCQFRKGVATLADCDSSCCENLPMVRKPLFVCLLTLYRSSGEKKKKKSCIFYSLIVDPCQS